MSRMVIVYKAACAAVGAGMVMGGGRERERKREFSAEERTPWQLDAFIKVFHKIVILVLLP